jgi:cytochrome c oxidase subunit 2
MEGTRQSGTPWSVAAFYLLFMAATVAGFFLIHWKLEVASEHGVGVDRMILFLLVTTGVMFVAGHAIVTWFLLRSRGDRPWKAPSVRSEWIATLVPIAIVVIVAEGGVISIGMPVWAQISGNDPGAVQVEVIGKQFEWLSHYPGPDGKFGTCDPAQIDEQLNPIGIDEKDPAGGDDVVVRGVLVLPVGRTASIRIRSLDVLHSFTVPLWRTKQDAVPGLPTRTQVRPTVAGKYEITCAELCGMGHFRMRAFAKVVSAAEFEKWLADNAP